MALIKTFYAKDPHLMLSFSAVAGWELLDNYRFFVAVEILEDDGTTWTQVMAGEYTPDASGVVRINVRPAFRGVFNPSPPSFTDSLAYASQDGVSVLEWNKTIRKFRTKSGGMTGTQVVPASPTTTSDYLVVLGGLSKFKFPTIASFFTTYLTSTKKFLTWAPLEKMVDRSQEDFLHFYFVDAPPAGTFRTNIKAYYDDGTTETSLDIVEIVLGVPGDASRLVRLMSGPGNCGVHFINPAKNVVSYEFKLTDTVGNALSETRTYVIDPVSYPNKKLILFINSLGSWEVLRFYGDTTERERYTRQVVRKNLKPGYAATDGEYQQSSAEGQPSKLLRTGYFLETDSKEWLLYMRDLMKSPRVYDVTNGTRVPLVVTTPDLPGPESRNYKYAAGFEAIEAYSDEVYTPDNA